MATSIATTVSSNFLPIPKSEASSVVTVLRVYRRDTDVSGSLHSQTALPASVGGGEDQGLINSRQSVAPTLQLNLLERFSFGWVCLIFFKSFSHSVQFACLFCLTGTAAASAFLPIQGFFFSVQPFSPSFGKSFQGSIDVRVCLLVYFMYMTEHLYNF